MPSIGWLYHTVFCIGQHTHAYSDFLSFPPATDKLNALLAENAPDSVIADLFMTIPFQLPLLAALESMPQALPGSTS